MTNTKSNSNKDQHQSDHSKQDKNSSQDKKQAQKHSSGRTSSAGSDTQDPDKDLEITDDPEGTKKKIPQMKK
ncbi:MAG TPA: hypothetical protein VK563_07850 [Puia sp.]|nr:hypothetical protein [Puia sp.]